MRPEHVEDAGRALFTAFYVDSLVTGVPPTYVVASPEQGSILLESFLPQLHVCKIVAVDSAGKVLGGACMQSGDAIVHAIGPLFVSPNSADRGVGKSLMRSLVEHARKLNAPSIRLTTSPERCWVATTDEDNATILGYTTGLFLAGHTMATSEAAWVAVMSRAIKEKDGGVAGISIPGVLYPLLIKWALATKLVLASHGSKQYLQHR